MWQAPRHIVGERHLKTYSETVQIQYVLEQKINFYAPHLVQQAHAHRYSARKQPNWLRMPNDRNNMKASTLTP